MNEHQQMVKNIKSDLLDIYMKGFEQSFELKDCSNAFFSILHKYFDIQLSTVLVYEDKILKSIDTNNENENIPWELFEPYFNEIHIRKVPYFLSERKQYEKMSYMILLKTSREVPYGVLLFESSPKWENFFKTDLLDELIEVISKLFSGLKETREVRINGNQYRKLYNMTDLFHSTMDINVILQNVLITIQGNFPDFGVELILSNDQDRQTTVNIKPFDYLSERPSTIEAFVSGNVTTEVAHDLECRLLNAPIKGRQAIYGILQVSASPTYEFTSTQIDFIRMLAQASGNALENAKLYHQSHRLVSDLQLINETSHRLNMRLDINEMLTFLQKQLIKSFQPMEICFVFKQGEDYELTDACTPLFKSEDGKMYLEYVEKHFESTHDPVFIADFSRLIADEVKYKSVMAIPMIVEERINGFSIVLHSDPYFFSFDSFKLMQSLIHHSSLAIANSILRNRLQEMVDRDHLTKLYARSYLDSYVETSLMQDDSGMFMLIDIDNFKRVNDTYGHQIGDQVLKQIGRQLMKMVGKQGICARWGGEELSVYVPNIEESGALELSEQIIASIPQTTTPSVTISAGLITWERENRPEFQSIFLQADTALYSAKKNGKNQCRLFDKTMQL